LLTIKAYEKVGKKRKIEEDVNLNNDEETTSNTKSDPFDANLLATASEDDGEVNRGFVNLIVNILSKEKQYYRNIFTCF